MCIGKIQNYEEVYDVFQEEDDTFEDVVTVSDNYLNI